MGEVRYAPQAALALVERLDYVRSHNPSGSRALLADVERTASQPALGVVDGRLVRRSGNHRVHLTRKYRYRLADRRTPDGVEVLDILHPRSNARSFR